LTSERSQVGIACPRLSCGIIGRHEQNVQSSYRAFTAALITSAAQADGPNTSAQGLLSAWKGDDPNMRMVAEVIASAFASGLSWKGTLAGKEVYCPPQGFKGGQVMAALDQFLVSNPDMAEKSYGDAMAASLSQAFPCQPQ
jgi:Rap1a immunity proteins